MKAVTAAVLAVTLLATPAAAYADWEDFLGTVETPAVTGAISVDVITYIPGDATGGAAGALPIGTVETPAVTGAITVDVITYVPGGATGGGAATLLGIVRSDSVVEPMVVGDFLYVPTGWTG